MHRFRIAPYVYDYAHSPASAGLFLISARRHWIKDKAHLVAVPAVLVSLRSFGRGLFRRGERPRHFGSTLYLADLRASSTFTSDCSIDRLTAVMLLLVTTVSSLVHIYTIGYMHGDPGYARFFSYIALFTFSMLMLVMADNLLAALRLLGSGRSLFLSADRPLVRTSDRLCGRHQGLPRQPRRRLRLHARPPAGLVQLRIARLSRHLSRRVHEADERR